MKRRVLISVILAAALSGRAAGDPVTHIKSPSSVKTDGGVDLRLPPGYFFDEPTFASRDAEMRRLQEQETRLKAENGSLRSSASETSFGWKTLGMALVVGFGLGVYAVEKL